MPDSIEQQKPIQWMSMDEVESRLERKDATALEQAVKRVRDEVAPKIIRHRNEEAADFADAQHQIVGYEPTR
ncbi:hypothetical protein [Crateriforma conspicua]|uniref:hypothetical protein n=1 Tax=Crateriforma conspicua TaxID=2527996 RepID=UPI00118A543C|nr:hypothetical protein [Crateriforma conspicua]QDV62647.1 hypothetical protein Mal65_17810 [Crateriforma conspicua]